MKTSKQFALFLATSTSSLFRSASAFSPKFQRKSLATFVHHHTSPVSLKRSRTFTQANMSTTSSLPANENTKNTKVALLQFKVTEDKPTNHKTAASFLQKAHEKGASLAVLPEIWNSPYATTAFEEYSEKLPEIGFQYSDNSLDDSPSAKLLFEAAMKHEMYIIGGSIPEQDGDGNIFNTCLCISPSGKLIGKHRKVHLFDIDVKGGIRFMESDTLSPGNTLTAFSAGEGFGNIGVGICYDIRFPEYALLLNQKYKVNLLIYPGAFNLTTGPAHWELLQRARAVDNQCFVLTASPARTEPPEVEGKYKHYTAWGHSTVISPWGEVVGTCGHEEEVVVVDLEMEAVSNMRQGIPTANQKRSDMYSLTDGTK